ncbi:MAG TPA: heavy-metal-associated domain-containing protein [Chitinophagaceae bacterium]
METMKFKTNIKCSGCVAAVTPELNKAVGESNWKVDVQNPEKVLTVDADGISSDEIISAVNRAGYQAAEIQ